MLTLFTMPKPFHGHIGVIQRNALRSWTLLKPKPEILLLGDETGTKEICEEFDLHHIPDVATNEFGSPLMSAIFEIGRTQAANPLLCYINADVILGSSFQTGIERALQLVDGGLFLLIGRRWNVFLRGLLDFDQQDWQQKFMDYASAHGYLESAGAIDYFVFQRGINWEYPAFAIGRGAYDGWFLYTASRRRIPIIDASRLVTVYHQQHDSAPLRSGKMRLTDKEWRRNQKLRGSFAHQYNIYDSDLLLTAAGLERVHWKRKVSAHFLRFRMFASYYVHALYPYSYPVLAGYRAARRFVEVWSR